MAFQNSFGNAQNGSNSTSRSNTGDVLGGTIGFKDKSALWRHDLKHISRAKRLIGIGGE